MSATTLTEFVLARIAEDEDAARGALGEPSYDHFGDTAAEETLEMALSEGCAPEGAAHFRRHYPARVLAECEAKRQIVELHEAVDAELFDDPDECAACYGLHPCDTLALLASAYADHPDYLQEWKP